MESRDGKEAYLKVRQKELIREIQQKNIQKKNQEAQLSVDKVKENVDAVVTLVPEKEGTAFMNPPEEPTVAEQPSKKRGRKKKTETNDK